MAKESRSIRGSRKNVSDTPGTSVKIDSGQVGKRGSGIWLNEQGELCVGSECFSFRVKPGSGEVRVKIDRNECGEDLKPVIDTLFQELGRGAPTIYESTSKK